MTDKKQILDNLMEHGKTTGKLTTKEITDENIKETTSVSPSNAERSLFTLATNLGVANGIPHVIKATITPSTKALFAHASHRVTIFKPFNTFCFIANFTSCLLFIT